MNKYETIFILNASLKDEEVKNKIEEVEKLISNNGEIENVEDWGRKKLAYPIQKQNEGYYVLINFSSKAEFIEELERVLHVMEEVIKYIVVKK